MALESEKDCKEITQRSGNADYDHVYERVRKFLRPLEKRWDYVQSVLLWEKPTHTLGYFIAMTSIFSLVSSGKFRVLLLTGVLMASSLLFEDVRGRVWQLFQQGGFNPLPDLESRDTSTPCFTRLCGKLAAFWCFLAAWLEKLNKLKSESLYKYYAVLFGLLLVAVFAYQYLPLMPILYTSACALYFWPVLKYFGMHKTVQKSLEPFYKPFVVQWQHSRTKRLRDSELTGKLADDSDDEFAEELHPTTSDAAADQDIAVEEDHLSDSEPPSPSTPLEVRLLQGIVTSAVTQGLNLASSGVESTQDAESPVPESPESFDNSAVFLEGLRVSSLSQIKDGVEVEEGEFMEGLEFPEVDKDTCSSSTESLHMVGKSGSGDHDQNEPNSQTDAKQLPKETRAASKTPESLMTSSGNTDVSDFELLDQAEAEGMTGRDETDKTVASTTSSLGSVTSYVGKWLGY